MPTYDYRCEANGQIYEVKHGMQEVVDTWGELCEKTGIAPGNTPVDTRVTKLATGGQVVKSSNLRESAAPCGAGGCGMCPMN